MSFGAYLAGCAGLAAGLAAVLVIAVVLRRCLVGGWSGPPAWLATVLLATASALFPALLLGTFGLFTGWSWLLLTGLIAALCWRGQERIIRFSARLDWGAADREPLPPAKGASALLNAGGLAIAAAVIGAFIATTSLKLGTGMTGFDTTWYHGPFAAGFAQSGDTFQLHQLAPQFLSWFYPQNSELVDALGILAFGNDLLSPLVNLFWLGGCLLAAWVIGRPWGGAPVSLAGVALALGSMAMADQAGEARNDIVGIFFLLAGLAVLVNAAADARRPGTGPVVLVALAAGLAIGTKINFIPAGLLLAGGALWLTGSGRRQRAAPIVIAGLFIGGGGYWYLRNLIHSGNPLPWIDHIGSLSLPGPTQDVGGRGAGSVFGYLGDPGVIRDWFLPGLSDGFGTGWPVLLLLAIAGIALCLGRRSEPVRRLGAAVAVALALAWLLAPTSASGPAGEPAGFVSGLRYLAPAMALGLALAGSAAGAHGPPARRLALALMLLLAPFTIATGGGWTGGHWVIAVTVGILVWLGAILTVAFWRPGWAAGPVRSPERVPGIRSASPRGTALAGRGLLYGVLALVTFGVVIGGQGIQRHYFEHRYAAAEFTTAGLGEIFAWARGVKGERIGTTATRQYPLFGRELDNRVQFIGEPQPHGGFIRATGCPDFREAVNRGRYRYLVTALDRPARMRDFPAESGWVETDPAAREIIRRDGAVLFELDGPLDPGRCR